MQNNHTMSTVLAGLKGSWKQLLYEPEKKRKGKQTLPLHEAGDQIQLRSQPVPDNLWQRWRMVRQDCLRYGALDHQHWENKLT